LFISNKIIYPIKQMSTGDQSAYIRRKLEERKRTTGKPMRFMRDGFDQWAESNTPARQGQMEKEPAPMSAPEGEMSVYQAKQMKQMAGPPIMMDEDEGSELAEFPEGDEMHGGNFINNLVQQGTQAYEMGKRLWDFYQGVRQWSADVKKDLRDPDMTPAPYDQTGRTIADFMERIGLGKKRTKIDHGKLYKILHKHYTSKKVRSGGAGAMANINAFVQKYGRYIASAFRWFWTNRQAIHFILRTIPGLRPYGPQVAEVMEQLRLVSGPQGPAQAPPPDPGQPDFVRESVPGENDLPPQGSGRHKKSHSKSKMPKKHCECECDSSSDEEHHGGAIGKIDVGRLKNISVDPIGRGGFSFQDAMKGMIIRPPTATKVSHQIMPSGKGAKKTVGSISVEEIGTGGFSIQDAMKGMIIRPPTATKVSIGQIKPSGTGRSGTSPWIAHVKAFAAKHGIKYGEALKKAGPSYHGKK
jgi:hypothetical protein